MAQNNADLETDTNGSPQFGRLLLVLFVAVMLIIVVTFLSEAYYTS